MRTRGGGRIIRPRISERESGRSRGQSLTEFAVVLPVFLLIMLFAVDFGRAFYSWVTVTNAARVAANYAGLNPDGPFGAGSTYDSLVRQDALGGTCLIPAGAPPQPTFQDSTLDSNATPKDLGDKATVSISCSFRVLTPVVGNIVGNDVTIAASANFTIRTGAYQP